MQTSSIDSPIQELYRHLAARKPFQRVLFSGGVAEDEAFFHQTTDIQRIISLFESFRKVDASANGKRVLGVYSNSGDGKSTLLGFFRYLKKESVLPIFVDQPGKENADVSGALVSLVWNLLFAMKVRGLLAENVYNDATVAFKQARDSETLRMQAVEDQMKVAYRGLSGQYPIWLCDNVAHRSCLQAFQQLLDLRDPEPPAPQFFSETAALVVFSTSEIDLVKAWREDPNRDAAGHKLEWLGVRAEEMFQIVKQILEASFRDLPEGLGQRTAQLRQENPVFPIHEEHLRLFLKNKARLERLEQARNDVKMEVREIQLRNTLRLLQRLIDAGATAACDCLIDLPLLIKEDLGSS